MGKSKGINLNLPAVDDLFTTQEQRQELELEKVVMLSPNAIRDFSNHLFQVREDEEMLQLIERVSRVTTKEEINGAERLLLVWTKTRFFVSEKSKWSVIHSR